VRAKTTIAESASEVGGQVIFQTPKTDRTRTVSLPRFVAEELAPLLAGKGPDDLVFTAPGGGPLRHTRFLRFVFRPAAKAVGLPAKLRFRDLRHTCAALLIAQGAHPRAITDRLGHSTIRVTMDVYGHLLPGVDEALTARPATRAAAQAELLGDSRAGRDDDGTAGAAVLALAGRSGA
jgi:integrase